MVQTDFVDESVLMGTEWEWINDESFHRHYMYLSLNAKIQLNELLDMNRMELSVQIPSHRLSPV